MNGKKVPNENDVNSVELFERSVGFFSHCSGFYMGFGYTAIHFKPRTLNALPHIQMHE